MYEFHIKDRCNTIQGMLVYQIYRGSPHQTERSFP